MTAPDDWRPNARMDPWCSVDIDVGAEILFGYAVEHNVLGGLSWARSSRVMWFSADYSRAQTMSGRRYSLGQRFELDQFPNEEAKVAFAVLVAPYLDDPHLAPPVEGDLFVAGRWVLACKMARHLKTAAPPRSDPDAVEEFIMFNQNRYSRLLMGE
ncbi:hypothetical protein JJQ90_20370 [Roseomonas sp. ROY-5-3]|uniref:Uncharacterized protein n=1 Tax=Falsiroseomonas oleicola TaxID=2801474 RepID=A0ABS6HBL1_9PROT|nr:hypothetical protein [Roseomonas oleicola]